MKLPDADDHAGLPLRRLRHDQRLHDLPVAGLGRLEEQARRRRPSAGRPARAARATRAWPRRSSRSRTPSATSSTPMPSRTSIPFALIQNKAGKFVAAGRQDLPGRGRQRRLERGARLRHLADQPGRRRGLADHGPDLHPDPKDPEKPEQAAEVLKFFDWAYKNGDKLAPELDYVPLPDSVVEHGPGGLDEAEIKNKPTGQPSLAASVERRPTTSPMPPRTADAAGRNGRMAALLARPDRDGRVVGSPSVGVAVRRRRAIDRLFRAASLRLGAARPPRARRHPRLDGPRRLAGLP